MKIRPINICLTIMYAILSFCLLTTLIYNMQVATLEKISNSFYERNSLYFTISNTIVDYQMLYSKLPIDSVLYSQIPSNSDIRGVIFKGNFDHPNIKRGRFLDSEDFASANSKVAVVGDKVPVSYHDGKSYFDFYGNHYKVVGIMGYSMPTKLDKTVMLSLNSDLLKLQSQYVIGGENLQTNYNFLGNESLFGLVSVFDKKPANILHIVNIGMNQIITPVFFILIMFFNAFILTFFWMERKNDEIIIKKINGFRNDIIFRNLNKEFCIIITVGLFIGTLLSILFSSSRYSMNIRSFIFCYIFIFVVSELYFAIISRFKFIKLKSRKLGVLN